MIRKSIKLTPPKSLIEKLRCLERVLFKNTKLCRLRKNLIIAGIGAFISSAVGGVMIAFVVAFFSCIFEEIYDIGIYDKKYSLNIEAVTALLARSFSLNSKKELKHPKDIMHPNASVLENFTTENHDEFSNAYQHAS